MKQVEVRLNVEVVAPLLDVIRAGVDDLEPKLAVNAEVAEPDEDFAARWRAELLQSQQDDLGKLMGLFDGEFFLSGRIIFDTENAEPVMRACAALRLHLRATHLQPLGDEALEAGEVLLELMPEARRKVYSTYVFLATMQELIVEHLDPTAEPDAEPEAESD